MAHGWDAILRAIRAAPPRITVVGDVMLDRWLRGGVRRLSREGPVPVVDIAERDDKPGGAANTAANLAALGARVRLLTVAGDDDEGRLLRTMLEERGVDTSQWVIRHGPTPCKTRIVGNDQMIVRIDSATHERPGLSERDGWARALSTAAEDEVVLVCDYSTGLFDGGAIGCLAAARPGTLLVDAHDVRRWAPLRPDVVLPNAEETGALLGIPLSDAADRIDTVSAAAGEVLAAAQSRA